MTLSTIIVLFALLLLSTDTEGQRCRRTNTDPRRNCAADECLPANGCRSKRTECLCDGDCGYSCVKKGLTCKSPLPRRLDNGRRVVKGRNFNDTATFTCNPGLTLSGASVRTCRGNGRWDGTEPKCGKICPDPSIANNTLRREAVNGAGFKTSENLHYYCGPGYYIENKNVITCKADGTWDGSPPQCYRITCPPPPLPNKSEVRDPPWFNVTQGARHGTRLLLACNPGYFKSGSSRLMFCNQNQWKLPTSFKCLPVSCGNPGVPRNGGKKGLTYNFRSRVTYYCERCYKLVGAEYQICNANGIWSDKLPTCQEVVTKCKPILSIPNGTVTQTSTDCGGKTELSCHTGHRLAGNRQIFCNETGDWSESIPRCEPINCNKFNASRNLTAVVSGYQYGSTVNFSCPTTYRLIGSDSMSCKEDGKWSSDVPECLAITCNKFNTSRNLTAAVCGYEYGSTVNFSCPIDYLLSGSDSMSCKEDGKWSSEVPECLAPCRVVPSKHLIAEKEIYQHGLIAKLKCQNGFLLLSVIDNKMPRCSNGSWSPRSFPYCKRKEKVENERENFMKAYMDEMNG